MRTLHLATGNPHKLREFNAILAPLGFEVLAPGPGFAPTEDGGTFADNAIIKARALQAQGAQAAVADDSGLEVAVLAGAPGIYSARYAGVVGPRADLANRERLLAALTDRPEAADRQAQMVCVIAWCAAAAAPPVLFRGLLPGHIARSAQGDAGFGYDPVFVPQGERCTVAQLPPARKNALSHRGQALRALAAHLGVAAPAHSGIDAP